MEKWERYYDSIGLSEQEIGMRQRAKASAVSAKTVGEALAATEGTYFSAHFQTADLLNRWGETDPADNDPFVMGVWERVSHDGYEGCRLSGRKQRLGQDLKVSHVASGEDVHLYTLLEKVTCQLLIVETNASSTSGAYKSVPQVQRAACDIVYTLQEAYDLLLPDAALYTIVIYEGEVFDVSHAFPMIEADLYL